MVGISNYRRESTQLMQMQKTCLLRSLTDRQDRKKASEGNRECRPNEARPLTSLLILLLGGRLATAIVATPSLPLPTEIAG